jgi:hypothetical protein
VPRHWLVLQLHGHVTHPRPPELQCLFGGPSCNIMDMWRILGHWSCCASSKARLATSWTCDASSATGAAVPRQWPVLQHHGRDASSATGAAVPLRRPVLQHHGHVARPRPPELQCLFESPSCNIMDIWRVLGRGTSSICLVFAPSQLHKSFVPVSPHHPAVLLLMGSHPHAGGLHEGSVTAHVNRSPSLFHFIFTFLRPPRRCSALRAFRTLKFFPSLPS